MGEDAASPGEADAPEAEAMDDAADVPDVNAGESCSDEAARVMEIVQAAVT